MNSTPTRMSTEHLEGGLQNVHGTSVNVQKGHVEEGLLTVNNTPAILTTGQHLPKVNNTPANLTTGQDLPKVNNTPANLTTGQDQPKVNNTPANLTTGQDLPKVNNTPANLNTGQDLPKVNNTPANLTTGQDLPKVNNTPANLTTGQDQPKVNNTPANLTKRDEAPQQVFAVHETLSVSMQRRGFLHWDTERETAAQLQGRVCYTRCDGTQEVNRRSYGLCLKCFYCSCETSCGKYGTCCPAVGEAWQASPIERSACEKADKNWILRVVTCDPTYPNNETRFLCESKTLPRRRDTALPVTSLPTSVTYANRYCAECRNDSSGYVQWMMKCRHNQYLYDVTNNTQYDDRALLLPDICSAAPPLRANSHLQFCDSTTSFYHATDIITTCNITGTWEGENEHVRHACEESDRTRGSMVTVSGSKPRVYANIFCAMCNEHPYPLGPSCMVHGSDGLVTLTELVSLRGESERFVRLYTRSEACPEHEWRHPKCEKYGTCCPKTDAPWQAPPIERAECQKADQGWILRVTTCNPTYPNNETRFLCESKTLPRRRDTALPVTSLPTSVTYTNRYCAECHNDSFGHAQWTMKCRHNQYLYNVTNNTQYDDRALLLPDICSAAPPSSPDISFPQYCTGHTTFYTSPNVTSTCNVTGRWRKEQAHDGCQKAQCTAGKVPAESGICQTAVPRVQGLGYHLRLLLQPLALMTSAYPPLTPPLSAEGNRNMTQRREDCDYAAAIEAALKKMLLHNYYDVRGTIVTSQSASQPCFPSAYQSQLDKLMGAGKVGKVGKYGKDGKIGEAEEVGEVGSADKGALRVVQIEDSNAASFLAAAATLDIIGHQRARDDFENVAFLGIFGKVLTVDMGVWKIELKTMDLTAAFCSGGVEADGWGCEGLHGNKFSFPYGMGHTKHPLRGLEPLFVPLTRRLVCQYVRFEGEEFRVERPAGDVSVSFPRYLDSDLQQPVTFRARDHANSVWLEPGPRLLMCLTTFAQIFPQNVTVVTVVTGRGTGVSEVRQVLSVVCSSVSLLGLLLTFLTYCLFRPLRSLPGLNNMGLCGALGLAQLSLLLPWLREPHRPALCAAVGMATHWVWLLALLWMGVCCLHMMCVFLAKTRRTLTPREVRVAFARNAVFTALGAAGVVGVTVGASLALSGGSRTGYGGSLCFLDTDWRPLLVLAFVLPLGLLVGLNLVCFVSTVASIVRVRRMTSLSGRSGRDVLVYVKLGTVTGAGWALSLLAQVAPREWMLVLAEACTALQGLTLCLAFVCRANVLAMYRDRFACCGPPRPSAMPATDATTTTTDTNPKNAL
ncbi:hypothetical protein ACOMHN_040521 [Nucella lapillus]